MLNVYIGQLEDKNFIWNTDAYFDVWFDRENLLTPFAKKLVKDIDKSEVLSKYNIVSPVLGSIPITMLSGGTKSLLLIKYNHAIVNLWTLGENCYQYLVDIAEEQDVTVLIEGVNGIFLNTNIKQCLILNSGRIVTNAYDYMSEILFCKRINRGENYEG
jgi:hypothetical protein